MQQVDCFSGLAIIILPKIIKQTWNRKRLGAHLGSNKNTSYKLTDQAIIFKQWHQLLYCSWFILIPFKVSGDSTVVFFIPRCYIICWPPGRLFYTVCGTENRFQYGWRRGPMRNTRHRSLQTFTPPLESVSLPSPSSPISFKTNSKIWAINLKMKKINTHHHCL